MGDLLLQKANKIIVFDGFNRANNTNNLGVANTGQTWQSIVNTWGIVDNAAYATAPAIGGMVVIDAGICNCRITCDFPVIDVDPTTFVNGIIFRYKDANNQLTFRFKYNNYALNKRENGVLTEIATGSAAFSNGAQIKIELIKSNIRIFVNGTQIIDYTLNYLLSETKHGLYGNKSGSNINTRWDNFKVEAI